MKVECRICIEDRDCPQRLLKRFINCNLYVGILRKSSIQNPQLYLRTANSTYQYQIVNNIQCIRGKNEKNVSCEKATIGFLTPRHYVMINCDSDKLVKLLRLLRKFSDPEKIVLSEVAIMEDLKKPNGKIIKIVDPNSVKGSVNLSPSLTAQFRQQYPYLWEAMQNLQKLELKDIQNIRFPVILGRVPFVYISLKNMGLQNDDLLWLNEQQIRGSLRTLDLSHNKLTEFPTAVIDCLSLVSLDLGYNSIEYIPHGIYRLQKLRILLMSDNKLHYLPADITLLKLENVDLSCNYLNSNKPLPLPIGETVRSFRGELRLEDWAALNVDPRFRLQLTARDCPNNLLRNLRSLSRCVCNRITPRSSSTEFYAPLGPVRFSASSCLQPQYRVNEEHCTNVYLQYHFCTYRNHCIDRKFKRERFFRLDQKKPKNA